MAVKFKVSFRGDDLGVFDSGRVTMNHAIQLETEAQMTIDELVQGLLKSSARATQAIVWFQMMRRGQHVPLHQDFEFGDVEFDRVDDEQETAGPKERGGKVTALPTAATGT